MHCSVYEAVICPACMCVNGWWLRLLIEETVACYVHHRRLTESHSPNKPAPLSTSSDMKSTQPTQWTALAYITNGGCLPWCKLVERTRKQWKRYRSGSLSIAISSTTVFYQCNVICKQIAHVRKHFGEIKQIDIIHVIISFVWNNVSLSFTIMIQMLGIHHQECDSNWY